MLPTKERQVLADDAMEQWYVFAVSYRKEIETRNELTARGFRAYIPMRYCLHSVGGKKTRQLQPAIAGLVFVRGKRKDLLDFRNTSKLRNYLFLKSHLMSDGTLKYIWIRDDDMSNFQRLNDVEGAQLTYYRPEELHVAKGSKVRIMDGPFEGITGIVQKLPGKHGRYLIVSLPDVAIATVSIKPLYVEPLNAKVKKSDNVEKDVWCLTQRALALLMESQDKSEALQDVGDGEMRLLMAALKGCKTFLPNDKARYHFAFYAARMALGEDAADDKAQLASLLPRLKANNLLLPVTHLLFYYEEHRPEELQAADEIIGRWDNTHYTEPQRRVLKLRAFVTKNK